MVEGGPGKASRTRGREAGCHRIAAANDARRGGKVTGAGGLLSPPVVAGPYFSP